MSINKESTGNERKKITLSSKISQDAIRERLKGSSAKASLITRKGAEEAKPEMDYNSGLSYNEKQRRLKALEDENMKEKEEEKPAFTFKSVPDISESSVNSAKKEVAKKEAEQITANFSEVKMNEKVILEKEKVEVKKSEEVEQEPIIHFKQVERTLIEEPNEPVVKVDRRDKTVIDNIMKFYRYIEFDSEEEIKDLQKGLDLRNALEDKRKNLGTTQEEDLNIISSTNDVDEDVVRVRREAYFSRHNKRSVKRKHHAKDFIPKEVDIFDQNLVQDIARNLGIKVELLIRKLRTFGVFVKEEDIIDGDVAELAVSELGHVVKRTKKVTAEDRLRKKADNISLKPIIPVVTVMGHVDHGKTSLLDALRGEDIASREAGGITQHIGAYQTVLENGKKITFLDTPGHEAFSAIRERGASVTHVALLVVAADDGVMPQTIEAINHAKAAAVPIVVAINKIDKPNADVQKIKNELLAHEIVADDLGGDVIFVPISAKNRTNLDKLCEAILIQAEILGAKAEYGVPAAGTVLEGKIDKQKGIVATLIVQNGTLKTGDIVVIDSSYFKVRTMMDYTGATVKIAEPSTPVEVYGLSEVPFPGLEFHVVENEKIAKELTAHRKNKKIEEEQKNKIDISSFFETKKDKKVLNIVIRADVQSTIEAIKQSLNGIKMPEAIGFKIMQFGVGGVTEADIKFAKTYDAVIFAFSVKVPSKEAELARKLGVTLKEHSIIYNIVDDVKDMLSENLPPIIKDEMIGEVEVRAVFDISKSGKIAGSFIKKGAVKRNAIVKVMRSGVEIFEGKLKTLKHFKDDVKELAQGNECGIQIEGFEDFAPLDILQIILRTTEKRKL